MTHVPQRAKTQCTRTNVRPICIWYVCRLRFICLSYAYVHVTRLVKRTQHKCIVSVYLCVCVCAWVWMGLYIKPPDGWLIDCDGSLIVRSVSLFGVQKPLGKPPASDHHHHRRRHIRLHYSPNRISHRMCRQFFRLVKIAFFCFLRCNAHIVKVKK